MIPGQYPDGDGECRTPLASSELLGNRYQEFGAIPAMIDATLDAAEMVWLVIAHVSVAATLSVTSAVHENGEPVTVDGVPEIKPLDPRDSPVGIVPADTAHEYGGVPLVAAIWWLYGSPTMPFGG